MIALDVAVVLVNHRAWRLTAACARRAAVGGIGAERVVVVDSASGDGSPEHLVRLLPRARVLALDANRGFAAAANVGLRAAWSLGARSVVLLNPDAVFGADALPALCACGDTDDAPTCRMPEILDAGRRGRAMFAGAWDGRWPGTLRRRRPGDPRTCVHYLWATCLLVPRAAWQHAGALDERFFLYWEDMDWCARARRAGVRLEVVPASRIWHVVRRRAPRGEAVVRRHHMTRGSVLFHAAHPRDHASVTALVRSIALARVAAVLACTGRRDLLAAHLRGWIDGVRTVTTDTHRAPATGPGSPPEAAT